MTWLARLHQKEYFRNSVSKKLLTGEKLERSVPPAVSSLYACGNPDRKSLEKKGIALSVLETTGEVPVLQELSKTVPDVRRSNPEFHNHKKSG